MTDSVAVVGAGAAGAATAYALGDAVDVTVFEASDDVGGRAATRRNAGCTYECGANYLPDDDGRVAALVTEGLPTDGLVDVSDPVWTFDADGVVGEGSEDQGRRWTYDDGLAELARRLVAASEATVHRRTRVETLVRSDSAWSVVDAAGDDRGTYDAVVLTPPAPQTADLLGASAWEHRDCRDLRETIASVPYRTVVSAALHYPFEVDVPYYALVADEDGHDVGWIGREECKPGHVPDGESLLLVQMAPDWSADHYHDPTADVLAAAADAAAGLLGDERLTDPDWTDHQLWRYALPNGGPAVGSLESAGEHDLYFAGDWVAGEARLYAAVRNGLETGDRLVESLD